MTEKIVSRWFVTCLALRHRDLPRVAEYPSMTATLVFFGILFVLLMEFLITGRHARVFRHKEARCRDSW